MVMRVDHCSHVRVYVQSTQSTLQHAISMMLQCGKSKRKREPKETKRKRLKV